MFEGNNLASPNVLYIGDSLFADLVDAKRDFGWTTAGVTPEVKW
jgi:predicted HAD superfamily phosphohydrolase YqeG